VAKQPVKHVFAHSSKALAGRSVGVNVCVCHFIPKCFTECK